jgi:hypothetical protein
LNRSQGILVAIGLAALAALAAPYLTRAVVDSRAVSGKIQVFESQSQRVHKDLVLCLIKRPGALNVVVASHDFYTDPASGLALKVIDLGAARDVRAWLPEGQALRPAQRRAFG